MTPHHDDRRAFLGTCAAVATVGVTGCLGTEENSQRAIELLETDFSPASTSVAPGTTVRWKNTSDIEHTVTAYETNIPEAASYFTSGGFDDEQAARNNVTAGLVAPGDSFQHQFENRGTYEYFCIPHESSGMTGTVQVD